MRSLKSLSALACLLGIVALCVSAEAADYERTIGSIQEFDSKVREREHARFSLDEAAALLTEILENPESRRAVGPAVANKQLHTNTRILLVDCLKHMSYMGILAEEERQELETVLIGIANDLGETTLLRVRCVSTLAFFDSAETRASLHLLVGAESPDIRRRATYSLRNLGIADALDIPALIRQEDERDVIAALLSCVDGSSQFKNDELLGEIEYLLDTNTDSIVRASAVSALSRVSPKICKEVIWSLYPESAVITQIVMRQVLKDLNEKDLPPEPPYSAGIGDLEIGDAVYNTLSFLIIDVEHAGIYCCYDSSLGTSITDPRNHLVIQMGASGIYFGTLYDFVSADPGDPDNEYTGGGSLTRVNSSGIREAILTTAFQQYEDGAEYNFFDGYKNPAGYIWWPGITFRCDGLVEYCYEIALGDLWEPGPFNGGIVPGDMLPGVLPPRLPTLAPFIQHLWLNEVRGWEPDLDPPYVYLFSYDTTPATNIRVSFTDEFGYFEDMDDSTFPGNITVTGSSSGVHSWDFDFNPSLWRLTINPDTDFLPDETVTVTLGTGIKDLAGNNLAEEYEDTFIIGSAPTYFISTFAGPNGNIDPDRSVPEGESPTFTAYPDPDYEVDTWYLDGEEVQAGGNSYQMEPVYSDHVLLVTFKPSSSSFEITVLSPNGGETYGRLSHMPINWSWIGDIGDSVTIELMKGGSVDKVIDPDAPNSGWRSWPVPSDQELDSDYRVRISSVSYPAISDQSDGNFTITEYAPPPDEIHIDNADDLRNMSENWGDSAHPRDGHYVVTSNIDASASGGWNGGLGFEPIGTGYSDYFRGVFDGQGYTISGLEIDRPDEEYVGLFRVLMDNAVVRDVTLNGVEIEAQGYAPGVPGAVGALAGENAGTIINCHAGIEWVEGTQGGYVGGLVGLNTYSGRIRNSSISLGADGEIVAAGDSLGGLAGENMGTIEWCSALGPGDYIGPTSGAEIQYVGGIAGENIGTIRGCYSSCDVWGDSYVGGIVGDNYGAGTVSDCYFVDAWAECEYELVGGIAGGNDGTIERCYVSGQIYYPGDAVSYGGLAGRNTDLVTDSVWNEGVTGVDQCCGSNTGECVDCFGRTTVEMRQPGTYPEWDFANVWSIHAGFTYPELRGVGDLLPPPTGLTASTGLRDGVHLAWDAVTYAMPGHVYQAVYSIYRADSVDGTKTELGGWQIGPTFIDNTAVPEVTYWYWVKAATTIDGARESDFSEWAQGDRGYPPVDPPTGVTASDGLADSVVVEWNVVASANYYRVYRSDSETGPKTPVGDWQTEPVLNDVAPNPEDTYWYWVKAAINAEGVGESDDFGGPDTGWYYIPSQTAPSVTVDPVPESPAETQDVNLAVSASDDEVLDRVVLHWNLNGGSEQTQLWDDIGSDTFNEVQPIGAFSAGDVITYWAETWDETENSTESEHESITVNQETILTPEQPSGPVYLQVGESGMYSTSGSSTNLEHPVEYQFDWGDETQSDWGDSTQSHSWSGGIYAVRARARCQTHTNRESAWSSALIVTADSTPPVVTISTNGGQDFSTNLTQVVLEGTSYDPPPRSGLTSTEISTGEPNEGTPENWRFTVSLLEVANEFTVWSTDNVGNIGEVSIIITRATFYADFTADPRQGEIPLTVQFTDLSQPEGEIESWLWDFGDGDTSTEQNPSHTYNEEGLFDVSLTVTRAGESDMETRQDYIDGDEQHDIDFTASSTTGNRPLTADFTDLSTGDITAWLWDFGDGCTSEEQNPTHTYYFMGDYTVTLSVSRPSGPGSETKTDFINVDQALPASGDTYKAIVNGVKVTYSKPTCFACYNEYNDTLLIGVWGHEAGVLNVVAKENAPIYWNNHCDVALDAPGTYIKKLIAKGIQHQLNLYICGQVGYVKNFILKDGYVGNTLYYGEDFGLGSDALDPPKKVLIKRGATTAPVLGVEYPELGSIALCDGDALEMSGLPTGLKPKPFDVVLFDDELDDSYEDDIEDEDIKLAELEFDEVEALLETKAAYVADIDGVRVRYSNPGCLAYFDDDIGKLIIEITEDGGNLKVIVGPDAYLYWGDHCAIYIDGPSASVNTMILKGRPETRLYVCGCVGYVDNFKLKYGCVGDTDSYGPDFGLYNTSLMPPNKILIKWGWTTAPLLGVSYPD